MKAVLLTAHGGPEMLRYGDAPDPVAGPGEVVVDIHAASVNAADYKVRLGGGPTPTSHFPHILGRDFSGVVSAVGTGVTDLAVGDAVFGVTDQGDEGAYAEKIAIKAAIVAKKPARLSHAEAAAMALTSLTALWAIEDTAKLKKRRDHPDPGRRRRRRRLRDPACEAYRRQCDHHGKRQEPRLCVKLGADRVIDYTAQDFTKAVSGCDVVFDTVGGNVRAPSYEVLKPGGRLVLIAPAPEGFEPPRKDVQTLRPAVTRDRAHLERMLALLEAGAVWPPNIIRYKLADAARRASRQRVAPPAGQAHLRGAVSLTRRGCRT